MSNEWPLSLEMRYRREAEAILRIVDFERIDDRYAIVLRSGHLKGLGGIFLRWLYLRHEICRFSIIMQNYIGPYFNGYVVGVDEFEPTGETQVQILRIFTH